MKSFVAPLVLICAIMLSALGYEALAATTTPRPPLQSPFPISNPHLPPTPLSTSTTPISSTGVPINPANVAPTIATDAPINLASNNCFDYYRFGSVQAVIASHTSKVAAGSSLILEGYVNNTNPYPIVNAEVYVKVYKMGDYFAPATGGYLVDEFVATSNVTVSANSQIPLAFSWRIPIHSTSGQYRVATYVIEGDSNLSGLSFTDDVQGNLYDFDVTSGVESVIEFDKTTSTLDGAHYQYVAFPPTVEQNKPIHFTAQINNSATSSIVGVDWKLYSWDGVSDEKLIATSSYPIFAKTGTSSVSYDILDTHHPVYFLVGTVHDNDAQSIINVRFVRNGVNQIRLEDPSIIAFPLKAGVPSVIFSCLNSMGTADKVSGGKLVLTLTDRSGNTIASSVYQGFVTGSMMLQKYLFTPHQSYDYAVLNASLYFNNTIVDRYKIVYDCKAIDPSACSNAGITIGTFIAFGIVLIILGCIILVMYALRVRLPKKKK